MVVSEPPFSVGMCLLDTMRYPGTRVHKECLYIGQGISITPHEHHRGLKSAREWGLQVRAKVALEGIALIGDCIDWGLHW